MATIHIQQDMKEGGKLMEDEVPRNTAVYRFRGKTYEFARHSCFIFGPESTIRWWVVRIIVNRWFDRFILSVILLNSIFLALTDYSVIDKKGNPVSEGSWSNTLNEKTDLAFTIIFTLECALKVIGMGFYLGHGKQYLKDPWNSLDFIVVVTSLVSVMPAVPDVSAVRCFRVLRPLKSLSSLPGLQALIKTILTAIPQLASVITLLLFCFAIFSILGLSLFQENGMMHTRCRLTPYPVFTNWTAGLDHSGFRCLQEDNVNTVVAGRTKAQSPWAQAQPCYWPIDEDDARICALTNGGGLHNCPNADRSGGLAPLLTPDLGGSFNLSADQRWCGANYDAYGNRRFRAATIDGRAYTQYELTRAGTYVEDLNWGFTNFDNILYAFITIFQSVTMEGWSSIMFMTQDAAPAATGLFFVVLIIFGSFLVLNLLLAVLEDNFTASKEEDADGASHSGGAGEADGDSMSQQFKFVIHGGTATTVYAEHSALYRLVTAKGFTNFVTLLIVLNTVVLAMDVYVPPDETNALLTYTEAANFALTLMFALEMVLKVVALGLRDYCSDTFNLFDGFIVIISFIELGGSPPSFLGGDASGGGAMSVLRSLRLFRIFKLAREWESMRLLLATLFTTLFDISYFALLLGLFIYVYALIGMQFFANRMKFDDYGDRIEIMADGWNATDTARPNFDTFAWAVTTVFVVLSGENWNTIMYDTWRAVGLWGAVGYYFTLIVTGMFIVMNLFLAILLSNFTSDPPPAEPEEGASIQWNNVEQAVAPEQTPRTGLRRSNTGAELEAALRKMVSNPDEAKKVESGDSTFPLNAGKVCFLFGPTHPVRYTAARIIDHRLFDYTVLGLIMVSSISLALDDPLMDPAGSKKQALSALDNILNVSFTVEMVLKIVALGFAGQPRAYLRNNWNVLDFVVVCISLVSWAFSNVELSAFKALRALRALRPLRMISRAPGLKKVVNTIFQAMPEVFNVMSVLVIIYLIFAIFATNYLKGTFLSCQGDMYDSIFLSSKESEMGSVAAPSFQHLLTFPNKYGPWGTWSNETRAWFGPDSPFDLDYSGDCNASWPAAPCCDSWVEDTTTSLANVVGGAGAPYSRSICECWGGSWERDIWQRFDHVGLSLQTFWEISTTEAWVDVMLAAVDSRPPWYQPVRDNNTYWIWFFWIFILFGSYLVMNLFVGVIIDNFQKQSVDSDFVMLTEQQQLFVKTQKIISKLKPMRLNRPPDNAPFSKRCYEIQSHSKFDSAIMVCICANSVVMSMQYYGQGVAYGMALEYINYFFALVFTVEAVIKLFALRKAYFKEGWNCFDFSIVLATNLGLLFYWVFGSSIGSIASIIRTFRIGRVTRLVSRAETLNQLFQTLFSTLVGLSNVAALLFLVLFIHSVTAMQLFSTVALHDDLTEHMNFQTFGKSLLTLIAFSTGENWNGFMWSVATDFDDSCSSSVSYSATMCGYTRSPGCEPLDGCGNPYVVPFMVVFQLLIGFTLINLFVGVILEDFKSHSIGSDAMNKNDLKRFAQHWMKYDPDASYFMPFAKLEQFLKELFPPWGVDPNIDPKDLHQKIARWKLKIYKGNVIHFYDVVHSISQEVLSMKAMDEGYEIADQNLEDAMAKVMHAHNLDGKETEVLPSGESLNIKHHYAATVLQHSFRRMKEDREEGGYNRIRSTQREDSKEPLLGIQEDFGLAEDIDANVGRQKPVLQGAASGELESVSEAKEADPDHHSAVLDTAGAAAAAAGGLMDSLEAGGGATVGRHRRAQAQSDLGPGGGGGGRPAAAVPGEGAGAGAGGRPAPVVRNASGRPVADPQDPLLRQGSTKAKRLGSVKKAQFSASDMSSNKEFRKSQDGGRGGGGLGGAAAASSSAAARAQARVLAGGEEQKMDAAGSGPL